VAANLTGLLDHGRIRLKKLTSQLAGETPNPSLYWDCGPQNKSRGVGFNVAYRFKSVASRNVRELPRKPVVLDVFAGCGGLGAGLAKAGFDVKYMVEYNKTAAATLRSNFKGGIVYEEDIKLFREKVASGDPCYPKRGDIDHVHGSSPCQGFSDANRNGGKNDIKNNKLAYDWFLFVKQFLPRTASFENVSGILRSENVHYVERIVSDLLALGYQVRVCLVDASDYGVPQARSRVFLFASLNDSKLADVPTPTHGVEGKPKKKTVEDAIGDFVDLPPVHGSGFVKLANNTMVSDHLKQGTAVKTECDQLKEDQQAGTVIRRKQIRHYSHHRGLTVRERARLQDFPDDYVFCGSVGERFDQIGNAVPVGLAYAVGKSLMESHTQE
jgi:DNA (cytosine-5)-methyltransferase 1